MIPPVFLIPPALSCLLAARLAVAYWQASAEMWAAFQDMTASADIVPFPLAPRASHAKAKIGRGEAEIVRFSPGGR
jgi:hypothetical protein